MGSDLDLLLILKRCDEPIWDRLRRRDTRLFPLACDLLGSPADRQGHDQSQQIGSGDLARIQNSFPANQTFLGQADLLGPEDVAGIVTGFGQTGGYLQ